MAGSEWWAASLHPVLSQGDVLVEVPFGTVTAPPKYLEPVPLKGNAPGGWKESLLWRPNKDGMGHYLDRGRPSAVMVLSWGCEIDKPSRTKRVQVGLLCSVAKLNSAEQDQVRRSTAHHSLLLPDVPEIGEHYLDLRCITYLPADVALGMKRVASMSDQALVRLHAQLVGFFTRIDFQSLMKAIPSSG